MKVFADGANVEELFATTNVDGYTTNPSLMCRAGVFDYLLFVKNLVAWTDKPVSVEVVADEFDQMERQAHLLSELGENVYVKIPITNTRAESSVPLLARLAAQGVKVNATAITTVEQAREAAEALSGVPAIVSVFAGRIADAGVDPVPLMRSLDLPENVELLWASPREILNVVQAKNAGCDIITLTPALLAKLDGLGRDLTEVSLDTVRMFRDDALAAGYDF